LDLLIKLRDLVRDHAGARARCQGLFDHILVDEFQDTDPLQAEIVLFLCEDGACANRFEDVALGPHRLTVVGDPQQSIYRFRRADVAMYDLVRRKVEGSDHLEARLSSNFRSRPELIDWYNARLSKLLGPSEPVFSPFDPDKGTVTYQPLAAGCDGRDGPSVVALGYSAGERASAGEKRAVEAEALARYLRWLVDSGFQVRDPLTEERRPVGFGDVAILNLATSNLPLVFEAFDRFGIPYVSRGGKLFLQDPLHRRFLLGLRAIADPSDGPAGAALLGPPFFALDPQDVLAERAACGEETPADEGARRAREALSLVRDLRVRRFQRPPGATARDLLERTAFARTVALGPNGAQRVERLRELCLAIEARAAADGIDFDAVTAVARGWVDAPVLMDAPAPVDATAVQVITVFQAKGLEFPVTVWWDASAQLAPREDHGAWRVERDGSAWSLSVGTCAWEEPAGCGLAVREATYRQAERLRLVYVALTRARDLLVLPQTKPGRGRYVTCELLEEMPETLVAATPVFP
ncbi:MAG: UvrD-helicase domain-containing protein, partial [Deltaproteobacteria bacterium]|nr:UvrD-helicase domain-containing protein [Deltaproteobacteria bacterium]